jgi:hypothetical protein
VDVQATPVEPVAPEAFDFDAYADYESSLLQRCRAFWAAPSGVLVYRRMRVAEVYSHGCRDMKRSLELQLGALHKSMQFMADVPNFLEPWYGIGTVASAFGVDYVWKEGQPPASRPKFRSARDAINYRPTPVAQTAIGKRTLELIHDFLERTHARLPMSLTDTQSPLDTACSVVDINGLFMDMFDNPEAVSKLLMQIAELLVQFTHEQVRRIGEVLVWPGHGFASCRCFDGLGMSDDDALMLSDEHYLQFAAPAAQRAAEPFGGPVFHSCGDWSGKIDAVKRVNGLRMVDGAFSAQTDPSPNPPEPFAEAFANTGIVVNARIVGGREVITDIVRRLWTPGLKLIVVTYCQEPDEQAEAYERIHEICG